MPNNKEVAKKIASSLGSYGLESLIKDILDCYYPVKQEPVGFRAMQGNMNVAVIFKDRFNPEQYEAIEKLHIKSFKSRMEYLYTSPVTDVEEIIKMVEEVQDTIGQAIQLEDGGLNKHARLVYDSRQPENYMAPTELDNMYEILGEAISKLKGGRDE